jgi:hypothetical protein
MGGKLLSIGSTDGYEAKKVFPRNERIFFNLPE